MANTRAAPRTTPSGRYEVAVVLGGDEEVVGLGEGAVVLGGDEEVVGLGEGAELVEVLPTVIASLIPFAQ